MYKYTSTKIKSEMGISVQMWRTTTECKYKVCFHLSCIPNYELYFHWPERLSLPGRMTQIVLYSFQQYFSTDRTLY